MLAALEPTTVVFATIGPHEHSLTFTLVFDETTMVLTTIAPCEVALTMLLIVLPQAVVPATVHPDVESVSLHFVRDEIPFEGAAVGPNEFAPSVLLPKDVVSLKDCPIGPDLLAEAMVLIIEPLADVVGPVHVDVLPLTVRSVFLPIADIDVSICVDDPTVTCLSIVYKVAVKSGSIRPNLSSPPVSLAFCTPISDVFHLGWEESLRALLFDLSLDEDLAVWVIPVERTNLLNFLIDDLALVVRGKLAVLRRVSRPKVHRWVFNDVPDKPLCQESPRASLQMHDSQDVS